MKANLTLLLTISALSIIPAVASASPCDPIMSAAQKNKKTLKTYENASREAFWDATFRAIGMNKETNVVETDEELRQYSASVEKSNRWSDRVRTQRLLVAHQSLNYLECVVREVTIVPAEASRLIQLQADVRWTLWTNGAFTKEARRRLDTLLSVLGPLAPKAPDESASPMFGSKI